MNATPGLVGGNGHGEAADGAPADQDAPTGPEIVEALRSEVDRIQSERTPHPQTIDLPPAMADQDTPAWPCEPPDTSPHECTLCGKPFATELLLKTHIAVYRATGERCWRVSQINRR